MKPKMIIGWLLFFFLIAFFVKLFVFPDQSHKKANPSPPDFRKDLGKGSEQKIKKSAPKPSAHGAKTFPLIFHAIRRPSVEPVELPNQNRGRSEDFFLEYLWEYFPTYIHVDVAIPIKDEYYYPDFAFLDKKNRIFIDIEIDEPYAARNGYPTHYIGADDYRNQFFLQRGWWIIRFTEEQVIRQPIRCCKVIAEVAAKAQKNAQLADLFYGVPDLDIYPKQWTKAQSKQLHKIQYRKQYKHLIKWKKKK